MQRGRTNAAPVFAAARALSCRRRDPGRRRRQGRPAPEPPAEAAPEDTALAVPRLAPRTRRGRPAAAARAQRRRAVRRIFALQAKADIPAAVAEMRAADRHDAARPHPGRPLSRRSEPRPSAGRPAGLARPLRRPAGRAGRSTPCWLTPLPRRRRRRRPPPVLPAFAAPCRAGDDIEPADRLLAAQPGLDRTVREAARAGDSDGALRLIAPHPRAATGLRRPAAGRGRPQILFTPGPRRRGAGPGRRGRARQAARRRSASRPMSPASPPGGWTGRDWRAPLFEAASARRWPQPGQRAGAAFWAARAQLRSRRGRLRALDAAGGARSRAPSTACWPAARSASRSGRSRPFEPATLGEADVDAVAGTPAGRRAFALLQVGQDARAAAELRLLWPQTRDQPGFAPLDHAGRARPPGCADLADQLADADRSRPRCASRRRGCGRPAASSIDPALVYALARLESNFDAARGLAAGARGLMQIMPGTADFILGGAGAAAARLHDPAANLDLGQRYLLALAQLDLVGGDLIRLLASYNAGPGSFGRWSRRMRAQRTTRCCSSRRAERRDPRLCPARAGLYLAVCGAAGPAVAEPGRAGGRRAGPRVPGAAPGRGWRRRRSRRLTGERLMPHRRKPPLRPGHHRRADRVRHAHRWPTTRPATRWSARIEAAGHRVAARAIERDDAGADRGAAARAGSPTRRSTSSSPPAAPASPAAT